MKPSNNLINNKYKNYIEEGHYGCDIYDEEALKIIDAYFNTVIPLPGFKFSQIKLKFGMARVYTNLSTILEGKIGLLIEKEMEDEINKVYAKRSDKKETTE